MTNQCTISKYNMQICMMSKIHTFDPSPLCQYLYPCKACMLPLYQRLLFMTNLIRFACYLLPLFLVCNCSFAPVPQGSFFSIPTCLSLLWFCVIEFPCLVSNEKLVGVHLNSHGCVWVPLCYNPVKLGEDPPFKLCTSWVCSHRDSEDYSIARHYAAK